MMTKVVEVQTKLPVLFGANDVAKLVDEARLAVRREAHHFSFVAVMRKAEKLRRRGVDDAGRVRILDLAQHLDRVSFTNGPHRRDEIAKAVDRQQRRAFKRRDKETTGEMCAMMLDVVKARAQLLFRHAKHARQLVFQIAHLRSVAEPIFDLRRARLATRVAANRIFLCRCADGSREIPTWSKSSSQYLPP
jgi:hypothetical protein